jgi:hypothetical protein
VSVNDPSKRLPATFLANREFHRIAEEMQKSTSLIRDTEKLRGVVETAERINEAYRKMALSPGIQTLIKQHETASAQLKILQKSGIFEKVSRIQAQQEAMMVRINRALPPAFLARQHEIFSPLSGYQTQISAIMEKLRIQTLPSTLAAQRFASEMQHLQDPRGAVSERVRDISERLASITSPWVLPGSERASVVASLHLAKYSDFARELPAFSKERFALTNSEFGAFDRALLLAESFEDEEDGEAVYTDSGRTEALVAFPSESYDDVLAVTGWAFEIPQPDFIRPDGTILARSPIDPRDHYLISMIEAHLRRAIYAALVTAGGATAVSRLFGNKIPDWERKRDDALRRGEPELHLIYYADFMEMADIILNNELWTSTFKSLFRHKDRLRITLERVHALRIPSSHSRPLTRTGRLRLWAEAREILEALGIAPNWR